MLSLTLAVCFHHRDPSNRRKGRFVGGVVTPASPTYVHGQLLQGEENQVSRDVYLKESKPVLAIASTARGYLLYQVCLDTRTCKVMDGLTEDAMFALWSSGGHAPPLFLHSSVPAPVSRKLSTGARSEGKQVVSLRGDLDTTVEEKAGSFMGELLNSLRKDSNLGIDEAFFVAKTQIEHRPRPLYMTTATQIGVLPKEGIPSLPSSLLPATTPSLIRELVKKWLLWPPPPPIASRISDACSALKAPNPPPVPDFPVVSASNVCKYVNSLEAPPTVLRDVYGAAAACCLALNDHRLSVFSRNILEVTEFESGESTGGGEQLLRRCKAMSDDIEDIVVGVKDGLFPRTKMYSEALGGDEAEEGEEGEEGGDGDGGSGGIDDGGASKAIEDMVQYNEVVCNKVHRHHVETEMMGVDEARARVEAAVKGELSALRVSLGEGCTAAAVKKMEIKHDRLNNIVCLYNVTPQP
jgi:hypothetical protein